MSWRAIVGRVSTHDIHRKFDREKRQGSSEKEKVKVSFTPSFFIAAFTEMSSEIRQNL